MIIKTKSDLKFHVNVNGRFIQTVNSLKAGLDLAMSEDWYTVDFEITTIDKTLADTKELVKVTSVVVYTSGGTYSIMPVVSTSIDYEKYKKAVSNV